MPYGALKLSEMLITFKDGHRLVHQKALAPKALKTYAYI